MITKFILAKKYILRIKCDLYALTSRNIEAFMKVTEPQPWKSHQIYSSRGSNWLTIKPGITSDS